MARARNIKPGFFTNDELVELGFAVRLLFIGLWTIADKEGRLVDRPKKIKMEIFPADDVDIDASLSELQEKGFVRRYVAQGISCVQIVNWSRHQNPHIKEAPSVLPEEKSAAPEIPVQAPAIPAVAGLIPDSLNLIPDSLIPDSLQKIKTKKAKTAAPPAPQFILPDWIPKVAWDGFIAMRIETKNPITDHGLTLAVTRLEKLRNAGFDPESVLNNSTMLNYKGLFPPNDGVAAQRPASGFESAKDRQRRETAHQLFGGKTNGNDAQFTDLN